jgi:hypothetical protein
VECCIHSYITHHYLPTNNLSTQNHRKFIFLFSEIISTTYKKFEHLTSHLEHALYLQQVIEHCIGTVATTYKKFEHLMVKYPPPQNDAPAPPTPEVALIVEDKDEEALLSSDGCSAPKLQDPPLKQVDPTESKGHDEASRYVH